MIPHSSPDDLYKVRTHTSQFKPALGGFQVAGVGCLQGFHSRNMSPYWHSID